MKRHKMLETTGLLLTLERIAFRIMGERNAELVKELNETRDALHNLEKSRDELHLSSKLQDMIDFADRHGLLPDGTYTWPDGDTWTATRLGEQLVAGKSAER